jgi:hypothetical protein
MGLRRAIACFLAASGLAAGCASIQAYDTASSGAGGCGFGCGGSGQTDYDGGVLSSTGSGATDGGWTPGTGAGGGPPKYLCGGSSPMCSPDLGSTDCTQGGPGNPGGGTSDASVYACQLVPNNGALEAKCGIAGTAVDGQPCTAQTPCAAGFGCIGTGSASICRQYCCDDLEACAQDTYCDIAPVVDVQLPVPVCVPATNCELLNDATCPTGLTCAIVRQDGTTSCIVPGTGVAHDPCPCAPGYTCSPTDHTCLQLCHTSIAGECGPNGSCQGGAVQYPPGIGICVPY